MGLFDIFKKKEPEPKKFTFVGSLWIFEGLKKKYQNAEVFKLGKTNLTESEKEEIINTTNSLKGKIVLEFDQQTFMDTTTLSSNKNIRLIEFLAYSEKNFKALYENDVLKWVALFNKDNELEGKVTDEEGLKNLDARFKKQLNESAS